MDAEQEEPGEAAATRRWLAMLARESAAGESAWPSMDNAATTAYDNSRIFFGSSTSSPGGGGTSSTSAASSASFASIHERLLNQQHQQEQHRILPAPLGQTTNVVAAANSQSSFMEAADSSAGFDFVVDQQQQQQQQQLLLLPGDASSTWSLLIGALFYKSDTFDTNWMNVLSAAAIIVLFSATVIGNSFVIMAILIERNLRTIGNYLVLSLAIADLLVALLVMPMAGIYQILDRWTLGVTYCEIWTSADVFCCTASILHLLAIALDRYWAVTRVDYIRCQRNERRILFMIFFVWTAACIISMAPVFGWKDDQFEKRITNDNECLISQDIGYQIFATCTTFYFPLILTLIFYWKIYQVARKRIRRKTGNRAKISLQHPSSSSSTSTPCSRQLQLQLQIQQQQQQQQQQQRTAAARQQHPANTIKNPTQPVLAECQRQPDRAAKETAGDDGGQPIAPNDNNNNNNNDNNMMTVMLPANEAQLETDKKRHPTREKQIMLLPASSSSSSSYQDGRDWHALSSCSPATMTTTTTTTTTTSSTTTCRCSCHIHERQRKQPSAKGSPAAELQSNSISEQRNCNGPQFAANDQSFASAAAQQPLAADPEQPSGSVKLVTPVDGSLSAPAVAGSCEQQQQQRDVLDESGSKTAVADIGQVSNNLLDAPEQSVRLSDQPEAANDHHGNTGTSVTQNQPDLQNEANQLDHQHRRQPVMANEQEESSSGQANLNLAGKLDTTDSRRNKSLSVVGGKDNRISGINSSGSSSSGNNGGAAGDNVQLLATKRQSIREAVQADGPRNFVEPAATNTTTTTTTTTTTSAKLDDHGSSSNLGIEAGQPKRGVGCAQCKRRQSLCCVGQQQQQLRLTCAAGEPRQSLTIGSIDYSSSDQQLCNDYANNTGSTNTRDPKQQHCCGDIEQQQQQQQLQQQQCDDCCEYCCNQTGDIQTDSDSPRTLNGDGPRESCVMLTGNEQVRSELITAAPPGGHRGSKLTSGRLIINGNANRAEQGVAGDQSGDTKKTARFLALIQNTPIALYWLQMRNQFGTADQCKLSLVTPAPTTPNHNPNLVPNSTTTILVDKNGQSVLVNVCKLCRCPQVQTDRRQRKQQLVGDQSEEIGASNEARVINEEPAVITGEVKTGAVQQTATDLPPVDSDQNQPKQVARSKASGMVIAASTANIAVSTVGPPHMTSSTTNPNSVQLQQAAEGIESKRERKAAKTLSIITGVFVICWLPFFVMAILMPMLNIKPHKFIFALLLWLGYFNSMLNPIIYTIFSPDFRKAFKRLLCGRLATCWRRRMQQQEMEAEMAANKRANHIVLPADHEQQQTGCLGQIRHCLLYISPRVSSCCQPKVFVRTKKAPLIGGSGGGGSSSGGGSGGGGGWGRRAL